MNLEADQRNFVMMRELVELQNVRLSEREKMMSDAFKGSFSQQLEMQEKHHLSDYILLKKNVCWFSSMP